MKTPGAWLYNGRLLLVAIACVIVGGLGYDVHWEPEPPVVQVEFVDPSPYSSEPVRGLPDYEREAFGPPWADVDRNGCDTRNDVLKRDMEGETFKEGTRSCVVQRGTLRDLYTGEITEYDKGQCLPKAPQPELCISRVHVDHIVPLAWAWEHGASDWNPEQRKRFANDPANLRATEGAVNMAKGDDGPAQWLPPHSLAHCDYAVSWQAVLDAYGLLAGPADADALAEVLGRCGL